MAIRLSALLPFFRLLLGANTRQLDPELDARQWWLTPRASETAASQRFPWSEILAATLGAAGGLTGALHLTIAVRRQFSPRGQ
jgi:hypothetical protein